MTITNNTPSQHNTYSTRQDLINRACSTYGYFHLRALVPNNERHNYPIFTAPQISDPDWENAYAQWRTRLRYLTDFNHASYLLRNYNTLEAKIIEGASKTLKIEKDRSQQKKASEEQQRLAPPALRIPINKDGTPNWSRVSIPDGDIHTVTDALEIVNTHAAEIRRFEDKLFGRTK